MRSKKRQTDPHRATPTGTLIACPECDLVQHEVRLPSRGAALCGRCGAELYRSTPHGLDRTLAFTICGLILYLIANFSPLIGMERQGNHNVTTLYGAVNSLYDQNLEAVAVLVFVTTILIPGLELLGMLYILLPLRLGRVARGFPLVFRLIQALHPWGMVEVFMLGVLVSIVRLAHFATVEPGIALWSFAGLMAMFSVVAQSYNPREVWEYNQGLTWAN
jgi:paraquat-inducible protein A